MNFLDKRHELRWTLWVDGDFRKRSEAALTHPVTVAALAVLLLNDMAFKSMWPGSWVTGKLSDLAWVAFGLPLLAFLLSFLSGRSAIGQRSAFLASYAGLPLLYAAFNTFAPVHDAILWGLSTVSGGVAGSPLDVSDSIVIPFGLGIALWVWRRDAPSAKSLRRRCALLMAGVAALASVASSYSDPVVGITNLEVSDDGTVYAAEDWFHRFESADGGLTWDILPSVQELIEPGDAIAETPRGAYMIRGADIVLVDPDGVSRVVYSTAHMQGEGNLWVQYRSTRQLGGRRSTTAPRSIIYDERSGNLIAAIGIQGVLVGAPDGVWTMRAVADYSPVDFSFSGKTTLLLSRSEFWVVAFALSLSMTVLALAAVPSGASALGKSFEWGLGILALLVSGYMLVMFLSEDGSNGDSFLYDLRWFIVGILAYTLLGLAVLAVSGQALRYWRVAVAAFLVMTGSVALAFMLWLHLGIPLWLAQVSAVVLAGLVAVVQVRYIKSLES